MAPTEEEIVTKLKQLIEQQGPDLGKKKLLSRLNSENGWDVSSKDFRVYMGTIEDGRKRAADDARQQASQDQDKDPTGSIGMLTGVMQATDIGEVGYANSEAISEGEALQEWIVSAENSTNIPPTLPNDAWAAQLQYYEESTRCFILYGRGKYDYGITPNSDMQINIELCKNRIKEEWAKHGSKAGAKGQLEHRGYWPVQDLFEFYRAGARKAGLHISDVVRQFEAEYGANPLMGREPDSPRRAAQQARRAQAYKRGKLKILTLFARMNPGKVELDARGQVVWKDEMHGEFVVMATRIDKTTGQEVGDV